MNVYNNAIHHTTKHSPNEIFYTRNELLLKEIHDNILESYKKNSKMETLFKKNEKCLLINNILKTNQKTKNGFLILMKNKIKKRISFFKICVTIFEYINSGNYLIKINGNYNIYELYDGEIYKVDFNMLRKCEENIWNNLYKYINYDIKKSNELFYEDTNDIISIDSNDEDLIDNNLNLSYNEFEISILNKRKRLNSY